MIKNIFKLSVATILLLGTTVVGMEDAAVTGVARDEAEAAKRLATLSVSDTVGIATALSDDDAASATASQGASVKATGLFQFDLLQKLGASFGVDIRLDCSGCINCWPIRHHFSNFLHSERDSSFEEWANEVRVLLPSEATDINILTNSTFEESALLPKFGLLFGMTINPNCHGCDACRSSRYFLRALNTTKLDGLVAWSKAAEVFKHSKVLASTGSSDADGVTSERVASDDD